MSYALIILGLAMTIAGVRGTHNELLTLVQGDLSGNNSFLWWMVSVGAIGALGYIPAFADLSTALLALILIVLIISNKGVFDNFNAAIQGAASGLRGSITP